MYLEKGESRVKEDGRGGCRLCTVADSLGPEDISQRGWSRSDPEGCLVLKPSPPLLSTLAGQKLLLLCSGDRVVPHGTSLWNYEREILLSVPCSYPRQQPAESSAERWKPGLCTCSTTESVALPLRSDRALPGPDVCARSTAAAEMRATFCANYGSVRLSRGGEGGFRLERGE